MGYYKSVHWNWQVPLIHFLGLALEKLISYGLKTVGDGKSPAQLKKEQELQMVEEILEGLGPRYADWTGQRPVPVDGDLLLSPDFEFKRPFRLLPYGVKPKLNNFELTELRHLARPIPPHFVLG